MQTCNPCCFKTKTAPPTRFLWKRVRLIFCRPICPHRKKLDEDDRESYGITEDAIAKLQEIHGTIRVYAWYAIGAFKNFGSAEVEELNLKFGLKIGDKTRVPIVTEGSAEANFEILVKCKFPENEGCGYGAQPWWKHPGSCCGTTSGLPLRMLASVGNRRPARKQLLWQ